MVHTQPIQYVLSFPNPTNTVGGSFIHSLRQRGTLVEYLIGSEQAKYETIHQLRWWDSKLIPVLIWVGCV